MEDRFDFLKGQIINIGLVEDNDIKYLIPILVSKVNPPDVNGHNTYDYEIMFRGNCGFISYTKEKERYLWRWTLKGKESIPEKWYIDLLKSESKEGFLHNDISVKLDEIFYIDENNVAIFPYRD